MSTTARSQKSFFLVVAHEALAGLADVDLRIATVLGSAEEEVNADLSALGHREAGSAGPR
jgi:hypothetical protein